jgi:hypothetical protein
MEHDQVTAWLDRYEQAWRTPGTDGRYRQPAHEYRDLWIMRFAAKPVLGPPDER